MASIRLNVDHKFSENLIRNLMRHMTFTWYLFCLGSLMKILSVKDSHSWILSKVLIFPFFFSFSLGLDLKEMEGHAEERLCGKLRVACGFYNYNLRDVFTWWAKRYVRVCCRQPVITYTYISTHLNKNPESLPSLSLSRRLLKTVVMGQVLSLLICGTAVSCQYLANAEVETPMLQSFLNYALLLLVYTTILATRKGQDT